MTIIGDSYGETDTETGEHKSVEELDRECREQEEKQKDSPICPKCGRRITELEMMQTGVQRANVSLNRESLLVYEDEGFEADGGVLEYGCPDCGKTLADSEDAAAELLGASQQ